MALSIYDTWHNDIQHHNANIMLSIVMLSVTFYFCYAECRCAGCRYAECRGAALGMVMLHSSTFI
jgi:hypothetical protein